MAELESLETRLAEQRRRSAERRTPEVNAVLAAAPERLRGAALYEGPLHVAVPEYNGDDSWELPVPGTLVIGRDGVVRYAFVEPDHTRRAEPADVLAALDAA